MTWRAYWRNWILTRAMQVTVCTQDFWKFFVETFKFLFVLFLILLFMLVVCLLNGFPILPSIYLNCILDMTLLTTALSVWLHWRVKYLRVYCRHLTNYLEENSLNSHQKFRFRKGNSTVNQLIMKYEDITLKSDMRLITDVILFDFAKAFDTVIHRLLQIQLRRLVNDWLLL